MNSDGRFKKGLHYSPTTEFKKGTHYSRRTEFKKGEFAGKSHPMYAGGLSYFKRDKRWFVVCRGKVKVPFARVLMEGKIGRPMERYEIVHHVNHNSVDDRIDNLKIVTKAEHLLEHKPLQYRRDRRYVKSR
jgi:hypothetical protein